MSSPDNEYIIREKVWKDGRYVLKTTKVHYKEDGTEVRTVQIEGVGVDDENV